jgi:hypothetical protein
MTRRDVRPSPMRDFMALATAAETCNYIDF